MAENIYESYVGTKQQLELDLASENIPLKISTPYMNNNVVYPSISENLSKGLLIDSSISCLYYFGTRPN